jgi:hypothetical protein
MRSVQARGKRGRPPVRLRCSYDLGVRVRCTAGLKSLAPVAADSVRRCRALSCEGTGAASRGE